MNAHTPQGQLAPAAEAFLARHTPAGPHAEARAEAAALLRANGLPVREEAWHYTRLRALADHAWAAPTSGQPATLPPALAALGLPCLAFANGQYRPDLSTPPSTLACTTGTPTLGDLAAPAREKLVALNTLLADDGATLAVAEGVDAGTLVLASLAHAAPGGPISFHPRHAITLAAGARLTIIEVATGTGAYLHNPVTTIRLAPGAHLTHLRLQDEGAEALHLSTLYADIAGDAEYDSFTLTLGARLTRTEVHARLSGPRAIAHLNAAQLLAGAQHADFTTVIRHAAPATQSRQTVKNVLTARSHGVFQGKIEVDRVAQKTDGYQMNQALLLSPDAEINSKPQLEIYADDVKCSHGATVGELDADQLFYLRSRGIPAAEARAILVRAFLAEALDPISHAAGRTLLDDAVSTWWERHRA